MLITVAGLRGSGKSLFGEVAKKSGFAVLEMSEPVISLMRELGIEITNESVRNFATDFREKGGLDATAKLMEHAVREALASNEIVVIIGARSVDEVAFFKKIDETVPVAIIASEKSRLLRVKARGKPSDPVDLVDLRWGDDIEAKWGLRKLMDSCENKIENERSSTEFEAKVRAFLKRFKRG